MSRKREAQLVEEIQKLQKLNGRLWESFLYLVPEEYRSLLFQRSGGVVLRYTVTPDDDYWDWDSKESERHARDAENVVNKIKDDREREKLREMKTKDALEYLLKKTQS